MLQQFEEEEPEEICKNCRFFSPYIYEFDGGEDAETSYGECRRFPPKKVPAEESGFPIVENDSWCGEFDN